MSASIACEPCAIDTFSDMDGATMCTDCAMGTDTDGQTGQTMCVPE